MREFMCGCVSLCVGVFMHGCMREYVCIYSVCLSVACMYM